MNGKNKILLFIVSIVFLAREVRAADEFSIRTFFHYDNDFAKGNDDANHVLWQVYVREMGWLPEANEATNPTHIRVTRGSVTGYPVLVNDYDRVSLRLVAYVGRTAIGTLRIAGTLNGKMEVEHYVRVPTDIQQKLEEQPLLNFELNRLAVIDEYRTKKMINQKNSKSQTIFQALAEEAINLGKITGLRYVAAPDSNLTRPLKTLGFKVSPAPRFRYLATDANEVAWISYPNPINPNLEPFCLLLTMTTYHK